MLISGRAIMTRSNFSSDIDLPDVGSDDEINYHQSTDIGHGMPCINSSPKDTPASHSQCCGRIEKKRRTKRKLPRERAMRLSRNFVRSDAIQAFLQTWEPTLIAWASLLRATRLPPNRAITTLNLNAPVQRIDRVIAGEYGTDLPPRFDMHVYLIFWIVSSSE